MHTDAVKVLKKYYSDIEKYKLTGVKEGIMNYVNGARLEKIETIFDIVFNSDNITDETKFFIKTDMSLADVNREVNTLRTEVSRRLKKNIRETSYNNTTTVVKRDCTKLESVLTDKFLRSIAYDEVFDQEEYKETLVKMLDTFGERNNLRENLSIPIDTDVCEKSDNIDSSDFFEMLESLQVYLNKRIDLIIKAVNDDRDFVGYFNYLLSNKGLLDETVQNDRKKLIRFLNNEPIDSDEDSDHLEDRDNSEGIEV